jgi:hypothetical protein
VSFENLTDCLKETRGIKHTMSNLLLYQIGVKNRPKTSCLRGMLLHLGL